MRIQILASAQRDLVDGFYFYEKQTPGLGEYFLESLYTDISSLLTKAGIHPTHFGRYHRLLSYRFPFAIYYVVNSQIVQVHAVLDCRRNPAWIRSKLI